MSVKNETTAKIDFLWKTIARMDGYIATTNTKAALLIGLDTFLLGGLLLKASEVLEPFEASPKVLIASVILVSLIGIVSVLSVWITLSVVPPYLTSNKKPGEYHSLIFFGDVSEVSDQTSYVRQVEEADADVLLDDLAQQVHVVATIASAKFARLKVATRIAVFLQIPLCMALLALGLFTIGQGEL